MTPVAGDVPWARHRPRAEALATRYPFAAEPLTLYLALLDVWDQYGADRPTTDDIPQWSVDRLVPAVVKATETAGPDGLADALHARVAAGGLIEPLAAWLRGDELEPVDRFLARASLYPLLALGDADAACAQDPAPRGGRRCPHCGGLPQLSLRQNPGEGLVTGGRQLACVRCGRSWNYSASSCSACGETTGSKLTLYGEQQGRPVVARPDADDPSFFPHLRVEACATCQRYVIDVDLNRDPHAVPEVDELAALPLDLYAKDHGLSKITPNVMGF